MNVLSQTSKNKIPMKKFLFIIFNVVLTASPAFAQVEAGTWSIIPKVGVNSAMFSGDKIETISASDEPVDLKHRMRIGLVGGIDVDYRLHKMLSLTAGVAYSQQGSKHKDKKQLITDMRSKVDYINVPVLANFYITPQFAIKAGVQWGWVINKSVKGSVWGTVTNTETGEKKDGYYHQDFDALKDDYKDTDFSIPVGLTYDFDEVTLELRYNFGLTDITKHELNMKNRVIMFTLGYRIAL